MSNNFNQNQYDTLRDLLENVIKKIINYETRPLPKNIDEKTERIEAYKVELVTVYNDFVSYLSNFYDSFTEESKSSVKGKLTNTKLRVLRALATLKLRVELPVNLLPLEIDEIVDLEEREENTQIFVSLSQQASSSKTTETVDLNQTFVDAESDIGKSSSTQDNTVPEQNQNQSQNSAQLLNQNQEMALPISDILNGIPKFSDSQDAIRQFVADVDLMHQICAENQKQTILTIVKSRLTTAYKLGNVQDDTWAAIKTKIREKYRSTISFETAQERLLSIKQSPKENLDVYAERVRKLLDSLNSSVTSDESRIMNEQLAIRKFKQNILDEKVRLMALSFEHKSLYEAIAHATEKREAMLSSNVQNEKNEPKSNNKPKFNNKNNEKNTDKSNQQCSYCKKTNHSSEKCFYRPKSAEHNDSKPKTANVAKIKKNNTNNGQNSNASNDQSEESTLQPEQITSTSFGAYSNAPELRPFHLNF